MSEENNGTQRADVVKRTVVNLAPENKKDIIAEAVRTLPSEARKQVIAEAGRILTPEDKKDHLAEVAQSLSRKDRKELRRSLSSLPLPSGDVADQIWLIIVGAFAIVFVLSALALVAAAIFGVAEKIELLLTVVTTVAGILAGFISGRSSSVSSPN
jgi:hypothetical protein